MWNQAKTLLGYEGKPSALEAWKKNDLLSWPEIAGQENF
jgi:hypothetical protein